MTAQTATVFYADCDQFDNHRTGYHASAAEAEAAFWLENHFSRNERKAVRVYTNEIEISDDVIEKAEYLARNGSPSPALGLLL